MTGIPVNPFHCYDRAQEGAWDYLGGIDEAGRGALAGPVVAGAVLLRRDFYECDECRKLLPLINDSKQLSAEKREVAFTRINVLREAGMIRCGTGSGSVEEIAEGNILGATSLAMRRALDSALADGGMSKSVEFCGAPDELPLFEPPRPELSGADEARARRVRIRLLVDGLPVKRLPYPHTGVVKGDGKSFAIAMASILAKVTRDRIMSELDGKYPAFGLASHKGYGTRRHLDALREHGPCDLHRERFLRKLGDVNGRWNRSG